MAGDSEQTLQNHQQPNGGEPFLIGVSGGTASGKVRVRAPCSHGGRRMWPAPAGRVSCSLPPRGPRDPRSGPPRSGAARPRAGSVRGVGDQRGDPGDRGSRMRVPPTSPPQGWCAPSPVPGGGCDSWSGSCGGGAESGCLLFCKSGVRTRLSGLPSEPRCAPPPGLALAPAQACGLRGWPGCARWRARCREPTWGLQGFPGEPKLDGHSHGWDDSRGCCLLCLEEKTASVSVRKLYRLHALRCPGRSLLGCREGVTESDFARNLFPLYFLLHGSEGRLDLTSGLYCRWRRVEPSQMVLSLLPLAPF